MAREGLRVAKVERRRELSEFREAINIENLGDLEWGGVTISDNEFK